MRTPLHGEYTSWSLDEGLVYGAGIDYRISNNQAVDFRLGTRWLQFRQQISLGRSSIETEIASLYAMGILGFRLQPESRIRIGAKAMWALSGSGNSRLKSDGINKDLDYTRPDTLAPFGAYVEYLVQDSLSIGLEVYSFYEPGTDFILASVGYEF